MNTAVHGIGRTVLLAGLLVAGGFTAATAAPGDVTPAKPDHHTSKRAGVATHAGEAFTEGLIDRLAMSGFQVSEGRASLYSFDDCVERTYPAFRNCFLANPAAPYVVPVLKAWPDEYVDPATVNSTVQTDPGEIAIYRLDPREAIVVYGEMPPPGRYMGVQTWLFSRHGKWSPRDYDYWANTADLPFPMQYLFGTIPPEDPKSKRLISLSSLGDVVNNVVMQEASGYPFGQTRYFIITPSDTTDVAVRRALQEQGVPDNQIFTEQIPARDDYGPIGPLGMGRNAIDFFTTIRFAVPDPGYEEEAIEWRNDPPLTVLRVRAPDSLGPVRRYKSLTFEARSANSEAYLAEDLEDLVAALCDTLEVDGLTSAECAQPAPPSSYIPELVRDLGWTGPYCREIDMNCLADQQESALYFSSPRALDSGQVIAVVSTLATETSNATYVGLSANDASMMAGVVNVLDSDVYIPGTGTVMKGLKGSADSFAAIVNNTDKFFVHFFARDCSVLAPAWEEHCTPTDGVHPEIGDPSLRGMFIIALRDYIATHTRRGPDTSKLLTPRILTFTMSQH